MKYSSCPREGCKVASSLKCLEGFDPPNSCPYLSAVSSETSDTPTEPSNFVDLPRGEALTESQASEITRQGLTRVVVVAGPSGSGKTTILTSLFEAFLQAPFGNLLFAGSRTLVGFERRCHDARIASGRILPHTVKTAADTVDFLHLRLRHGLGGQLGLTNLLLSDISGERFRAMRDSMDAVKKMPMMKRADDLCVVLDGRKLADPKLRQLARTDARSLLRSLIEANALSGSCKVQIVFSKWDLVMTDHGHDSFDDFIEEVKVTITEILKAFTIPEFIEVAARPENIKVPFAFGLPTLLRSWLREPPMPTFTLHIPTRKGNSNEVTRFANSIVQRSKLGETYNVRWI